MAKLKSFTIFSLCIATLALTLSFGPGLEQDTSAANFLPQNPPDSLIWQVLPSKTLEPTKSFSLYTAPPTQYVVYGHRKYGINLVWTKSEPNNFSLERASGGTGPITYGEVLALRESTGGYIYYKSTKYGINLDFSGTPVYEWEVRGGANGKPVVPRNLGDSSNFISDVLISLYNRTRNCYVGYGEREYGINLV